MGPGAVGTQAAAPSHGAGDGAQIVRFFGRFDCLIEPALVLHLARSPHPEAVAEKVLEAMGEVPFYLTVGAFRDLEDRLRARGVHPDDVGPRSARQAVGTQATSSDTFRPGSEHEATTQARRTPTPLSDIGLTSEQRQRIPSPEHVDVPQDEAVTGKPSSRAPATGPQAMPGAADDAAIPAAALATTGTKVAEVAADPLAAEHEAHRKAALAMMIQLVYDQKAKDLDVEGDDDPDNDSDGDGESDAPRALAAWEIDWSKPITIKSQGTWRPEAAEHSPDIKILQDITGQSTCEGTTDDFHKYFSSRYHQLERILRRRRELVNAQTIERTQEASARDVALIGMIAEVRTTNNGHRLIMLEDETGQCPCLVVNNDRTDPQLIMSAGVLVPDEVLGIVGKKASSGDLIIVEQIIRPDIPYNTERVHSEEPLAVAFLSDIHVGSDLFLEKNYVKMLQWLNGDIGNDRERKMAGRIKYVVLPGDMVDGVGIYPGQEHGLKFTDIYDQYQEFGRLLQYLPDHIEVLVQPGNHDAARPNEPQPALDQEVRAKFDGVNAHFIGNPALFSLNDVRVLSYHGVSLMDFATSVTGLEHHDPLPIMEEILKCRHLAPIYGMATPLAPEHNDNMVIETIPELFVTGHVHTFNQRNYRGVQMVNCSTWQAQTDYQKMLNFKPDPCRMPIYDLKTLKLTSMDFGMGMDFSYGNG